MQALFSKDWNLWCCL